MLHIPKVIYADMSQSGELSAFSEEPVIYERIIYTRDPFLKRVKYTLDTKDEGDVND